MLGSRSKESRYKKSIFVFSGSSHRNGTESLQYTLVLSEGTIIAVDDHLNTPEFDQYRSTLTQGGKARYVEDFMNDIGAELLHDGYQIVWRL